MPSECFLIVNADDLGLSSGINAGIAETHERGIVTSASLMVRQSGAEDGADLARRHPELAVGLHLDLGQRDYETAAPTAAGDRFRFDDEAAVEAECRAQLAAFRDLLGRDPTHLDSHKHVHLVEPVAAAATRLAAELGIPLRGEGRIRYEGLFYGRSEEGEPQPERITAERLLELIGSLPPGWTELGCHPGRAAEGLSSYGAEREREIEALCDARVRAAIEEGGVRLRSFAQWD
jgi:predicted glycoside hydrolase/deacetylase ChbG (UPF0249 family)